MYSTCTYIYGSILVLKPRDKKKPAQLNAFSTASTFCVCKCLRICKKTWSTNTRVLRLLYECPVCVECSYDIVN